MVLFSFLLVLIVAAVVWWVITLLPLPAPIQTIAMVVLVLVVLGYALQLFGVHTGLPPLNIR